MRIRAAVVTAAVAILLAVPTTAVAGGGWWTWLDVPDHVGVGETITAEARVGFIDIPTAEAAMETGEYHAYLLRDVDEAMLNEAMGQPYRAGWWDPPDDLVWLAEVDLSKRGGNQVTATAIFEVPDVAPGEYAVMFCTAGCEDPMGNVIPQPQTNVFADAATAQLTRDVAEVRRHVTVEADRVLGDVAQLRANVLSTARRMTVTGEHLAQVERSLTVLEAASATEPAPPPPGDDGTPWKQHAGWFVAGLATAAAFVTWRRQERDAPEEPSLAPVPDDAGELVTGPPVPMSSVRR